MKMNMDLNTDTARGMVANMDTNTLREIDIDMDFKDSNLRYR
jgi:hypothetical protein